MLRCMCLNEADGHVQRARHTFAADLGIVDIAADIPMPTNSSIPKNAGAKVGHLIEACDEANIVEVTIGDMAPECIRQGFCFSPISMVGAELGGKAVQPWSGARMLQSPRN